MDEFAAATIVAKNALSFARVLAQSFHHYHPDISFFTLLTDEVDGYFDRAAEPFQLVGLNDLAIPDPNRFRFHYNQQELTYAATPYLLSYLLDRGIRCAAFFKQESLVLGDLSPILELLRRCSIALTPHLLQPLSGEKGILREMNILQSGVYNVGFLGVSGTAVGRRFLSWWQDRVYEYCRHNVPEGIHFEQRWLDLVLAYFDDIQLIRDPGFNVAHWNLPDRQVTVDGDEVRVDGQTCRFFRFSGFDPENPALITRYSRRIDMSNVGPAAEIFRRYLRLLESAGYHETKSWPYAYGFFDNGTAISDHARQAYREQGEKANRFGDPFKSGSPNSFYHWLQSVEKR